MKLPRSLLLAAFAAAALPLAPLHAQIAQPAVEIAPGHTLLTVSAEGRTFIEPDVAVFTAGVTTQGQNAAEALAVNARAMTQVIAALKQAGIAERDIQTSNLSLNPIYHDPERDARTAARVNNQPYMPPPPESQVPRIIGYTASNTVSVRQRDLEDYGKVVDTLVEAGANEVNGPNFQLDDQDQALDVARIDAVAKARQRAELYANAASLKVQRIVSISESGGYYGPPQVIVTAQRMAAGSAPPPPSPVQPGELQMTANVTVLFELAP
jgi:uncharacterized protein YggE